MSLRWCRVREDCIGVVVESEDCGQVIVESKKKILFLVESEECSAVGENGRL